MWEDGVTTIKVGILDTIRNHMQVPRYKKGLKFKFWKMSNSKNGLKKPQKLELFYSDRS